MRRLDLKIARLRFRGYRGASIKPHRSIYHLTLHKGDLLIALLLPFIFDTLLLLNIDHIASMWRGIFAFWIDHLNVAAIVTEYKIDLGNYVLWMPVPKIDASLPSAILWFSTLIGCGLLFLITIFIPSNRFLPLKYIIRACLLIQMTAHLFLYFIPGQFPYDLPHYIQDAMTMSLFFLFTIPWVLGGTYYVFGFPLLQKITLTCLTLLYFLIALPMQYLLHAIFLHHATLLFLPLSYLILGVFIDVMMFVCFYSWGMSWHLKSDSQIATFNRSQASEQLHHRYLYRHP